MELIPIVRSREYIECFRFYNEYTPSEQWQDDWADHCEIRRAAWRRNVNTALAGRCSECGFKKSGNYEMRRESDHSFCCFTEFKPRYLLNHYANRRVCREEPGLLAPPPRVITGGHERLPNRMPTSEQMSTLATRFAQAMTAVGRAAANAVSHFAGWPVIIIDDPVLRGLASGTTQRNLVAFRRLQETHPEWFGGGVVTHHTDKPIFQQERTPNRAERRDAQFRHFAATAAASEETRRGHFGTLPVRFGAWEPGMRTRPTRSGYEQSRALGRPTKRSRRKP